MNKYVVLQNIISDLENKGTHKSISQNSEIRVNETFSPIKLMKGKLQPQSHEIQGFAAYYILKNYTIP
jgi:hypothetical protein